MQVRTEDNPADRSRPWRAVWILFLIWLAIFAIRLASPDDIADRDQQRPVAYALDILRNGNWLVQTDWRDDITSKPPLYTWLVSILSLPGDRVTQLTLYLPTGLAMLGVALLVNWAGRKWFSPAAGFLGALACLLTMATAKHVALARTDALFAFTVTLAALLAYRAWSRGGGWTCFWLAAAAATLTKGPLGVLLALFGLLAVVWEKRSGRPAPLRGSHLLGVCLFLLITGGWFAAAYLQMGQPLIDKMMGRELVRHAVGGESERMPGSGFYKPTLYYLSRLAPWSVFAFIGLWRVLKRPETDDRRRRLERFCFCWMVGGIVLFSFASRQRPDHILPLMAAGSLLAGRELADLAAAFKPRTRQALLTAACAIALIGFYVGYHHLRPTNKFDLERSAWMVDLADQLNQASDGSPPVTHLHHTFALQHHLNTMWRKPSYERAAALLESEDAAYIAVRFDDELATHLSDPEGVYEVMRVPAEGVADLLILGNRPTIDQSGPVAMLMGALRVRMEDVRLKGARSGVKIFESLSPDASLTIANELENTETVRVRIRTHDGVVENHRVHLSAGETWRWRASGG